MTKVRHMRRPALVLISLGLVVVSSAPASAATRSAACASSRRPSSTTRRSTASRPTARGRSSPRRSRCRGRHERHLRPVRARRRRDAPADQLGRRQRQRRRSAASAPTATAPGTRRRTATSRPTTPTTASTSTSGGGTAPLRQISVGNGAFDAAFVQGSATGDHVLFSTDETDRRSRRRRRPSATSTTGAPTASVRLVTPGTAVGDGTRSRPATRSAPTAPSRRSRRPRRSIAADGDVPGRHLQRADGRRRLHAAHAGHVAGPTFGLREPRRHASRGSSPTARSTPTTTTRPTTSTSGARTARYASSPAAPRTRRRRSSAGSTTAAAWSSARPRSCCPADGDTAGTDLYDRRADDSLHLVSGGTTDALAPSSWARTPTARSCSRRRTTLLPADTDVVERRLPAPATERSCC